MDEWLKITETNWVLWIAGLFALLEFGRWAWTLVEWFISKLGVETKHMRSQRETRDRLLKAENNIKEIKETATQNVNTFLEHEQMMSDNFIAVKNEIVQEIGKLHKKIDGQHEHLEEIDRDGKRRDVTLMRDRILAGCRYFNQNKDDEGVVHISLTDFENMNSMIQEYFKAGGNGAVKHIYENEFSKYKIDSETFDKK